MTEELNKLIYENENLIYYFVNKYKNQINKEDLYQVGVIGIINAYKNYKKENGVKFSTYAYTYIMGEIKKYIREDKTIKISKDFNSLRYKINNAKILLSQKLMREVTTQDLVTYLDIDEYTLSKIQSIPGFIDIASNLVESDSIYNNIILNRLGNVIVVKDIDSATNIGKIINNKYKIVSLDGQVINVGGSVTGGSINSKSNIIKE